VQRRRYAGLVGQGAWCDEAGGRRAKASPAVPPTGELVVASSRSHRDEAALQGWLAAQGLGARRLRRRVAGSSLKFGLVACGEADLYPRLGRTMEWDTAAGHAVLRAAGGEVCTLDGAPLRYGKPGFENPHFVARGAP
jgi:3'(2'), 5'-bisphosphate nucleotidase